MKLTKKNFAYIFAIIPHSRELISTLWINTEAKKKATKRQIIFGTSLAGSILLRLFANARR